MALPVGKLATVLQHVTAQYEPSSAGLDTLHAAAGGRSQVRWPAVHEGLALHEGIQRRRLSNGIRVNSRRTTNEPHGAMLRMVAAGEGCTQHPSVPASTVNERR